MMLMNEEVMSHRQKENNPNTEYTIAAGTLPILKMRSLRKRVPVQRQRDRYYTEDNYNFLPNPSSTTDCNNITHAASNPSSMMMMSPPTPSSISSPRSTITVMENGTIIQNHNNRTLQSRRLLLGTIRHYKSTKNIMFDTHNDNDSVNARSQSSEDIPSSLNENHKAQPQIDSPRHDQIDEIGTHKSSEESSQRISPLFCAPTTMHSRAPICYKMTSNENPFVSENDYGESKQQQQQQQQQKVIRSRLMTTNKIPFLPTLNNDDECISLSSCTSSRVSSLSNDSVKRYSNHLNTKNTDSSMAPMFPPLEIYCGTRRTKPNHSTMELQSTFIPSHTTPNDDHTLYSSTRNNQQRRPPHVSTISPNTDTSIFARMYRLDAPKHQRIQQLHVCGAMTRSSPVHQTSVFIPIREKSSDDGEGSFVPNTSNPSTTSKKIPTSLASIPKVAIRSKTEGAIHHEGRTNEIFRPRQSHHQPNRPSAITATNKARTMTSTTTTHTIAATTTSPRRQFQRTMVGGTTKNLRTKPMLIQIPSKSVPMELIQQQHGGTTNGTTNTYPRLRRSSTTAISAVDQATSSSSSSSILQLGQQQQEYENDPLLRFIPRRQRRESNHSTVVSVFSFGSIVGQSVSVSLSSYRTPQAATNTTKSTSVSSSPVTSFHAAPLLPPPSSLVSVSSVSRSSTELLSVDDNDVPRASAKTTPFQNEMDYYWKQTKKRIASIIEKPKSMSTLLHRNKSGCLA